MTDRRKDVEARVTALARHQDDLALVAERVGADRVVYQDDHVILICARWQDAIQRLPRIDAVIVDAPYSERTHSGHDSGANETHRHFRPALGREVTQRPRRKIAYAPWSSADALEASHAWHQLCNGWIVSMSDHVLCRAWEEHLAAIGRYVFAPLPFVDPGSRVRMTRRWSERLDVLDHRCANRSPIEVGHAARRRPRELLAAKALRPHRAWQGEMFAEESA